MSTNATKTYTEVLQGLKNEISETLLWFAEMDLKAHGRLTETTKQCFYKQGVKIPHELATFNANASC